MNQEKRSTGRSKTVLTNEDKLRIAKTLGLWREGLFKLKTTEQWEQERITLLGG